MTNPPNNPPPNHPQQPSGPGGGFEFPPLDSGSTSSDPYASVDYPPGYPPGYPAMPPPVYPTPYPAAVGYPYPQCYPTDPYDPYRQLQPSGTNGKAVAALVCSIVGLMCCGLSSIAGIILGIMAMRETKRTGQDGFGLAVAGVAIGGVVVALVVLYFIFVFIVAASGVSYR